MIIASESDLRAVCDQIALDFPFPENFTVVGIHEVDLSEDGYAMLVEHVRVHHACGWRRLLQLKH